MRKLTEKTIIKKQAIRHLWFFVTERCNLHCSYCFYKHRTQNTSIDLEHIPLIFSCFEKACNAKFVISGGEALMNWPKTQQIIHYLRSIDRHKYILLQTNATLLDAEKIEYLAKNRVHIEIGLDGTVNSNIHRKGLAPHISRIEKNIRLAHRSNINIHATMTVCPDQTKKMYENFIYLLSLNIKKIEVTPAAFTNWKRADIYDFKKNYIKILKFAINNRITKVLGTEYDEPLKESSIDIILLPDGTILTNWALLSLTRKLKSAYSMFGITKNRLMVNNNCAIHSFAINKTGRNNTKHTTYREISNYYVKLAWNSFGPKEWKKSFSCYSEICVFLKRSHEKLLMIFKNRGKLSHTKKVLS